MENEKKLVRNSLYNVAYRCLSIIFPLVSSIYVARILTPVNLGKVSAAQNIVSYFLICSAMGIPTYGVKLVAQYKPKTSASSRAFSELWIINFVLSLVSSIIYYVLVLTFPYFQENRLLYIITGLSLICNIANVDWFYQGIQEYRYIAVRSVVIKILSFVSLFVFVRDKGDYLVYALLNVLGTAGNYIFNIVRLRKYVSFQRHNLAFGNHISHMLVLFGAALASEIYTLTDTTMLNFMCGSETVGYYSMSLNIIRVLRGMVVAVSAVFLPQLSYYYFSGEKERFYRLANDGLHVLVYLTIPLAVGLVIVSEDLIICFFGEAYREAVGSTRILAVSIISIALSNFVGLQLLLTLGKEKITTLSTIFGAVVNITLNIFLIIRFQHIGASIASAVTELCVTAFQVFFCFRYIKIRLNIFPVLIASALMLPAVLLIHQLQIMLFIKLMLETVVGSAVYFITTMLLRDEFVMKMKRMI
mgnify:CR=1 FL=1